MSRRQAQSGPTISLFPFLAVLLCTMGALLVLLVLFSRSANQADVAAEAEAAQRKIEELELARDEFAWRLGQLDGVRSRTADELAKARSMWTSNASTTGWHTLKLTIMWF